MCSPKSSFAPPKPWTSTRPGPSPATIASSVTPSSVRTRIPCLLGRRHRHPIAPTRAIATGHFASASFPCDRSLRLRFVPLRPVTSPPLRSPATGHFASASFPCDRPLRLRFVPYGCAGRDAMRCLGCAAVEEAVRRPGPGWKFWLRLAISAGLLLVLVLKARNVGDVVPHRHHMRTVLLLGAAAAVTFVGVVLSAWRWQRVL